MPTIRQQYWLSLLKIVKLKNPSKNSKYPRTPHISHWIFAIFLLGFFVHILSGFLKKILKNFSFVRRF